MQFNTIDNSVEGLHLDHPEYSVRQWSRRNVTW